MKGSGDYGVFALGVFNGQTANKLELNNRPHVVSRLSFTLSNLKNKFLEASIQAYKGKWIMPKDWIYIRCKICESLSYNDEQIAASFVMYPQNHLESKQI